MLNVLFVSHKESFFAEIARFLAAKENKPEINFYSLGVEKSEKIIHYSNSLSILKRLNIEVNSPNTLEEIITVAPQVIILIDLEKLPHELNNLFGTHIYCWSLITPSDKSMNLDEYFSASIKILSCNVETLIDFLSCSSFYYDSDECSYSEKLISQFNGIVGSDPKMLSVYELITTVSNSDVPVSIYGESGTGKELVAAAIHNESPRRNANFVAVNCGALPENMLESELFGYVRGAFTGAIKDKKGRFELADGGTIFLDEIGDISLAMQVKLLRVLQEGKFERLGAEYTTSVDVRIVSASNKILSDEIKRGRFREDLFYRLSVIPINLPSLRERRGDIPMLANYFLNKIKARLGLVDRYLISEQTMDVMIKYDWPGNIRELQNWIQFAVIKVGAAKLILPSHLPIFDNNASSIGRSKKDFEQKLTVSSVKHALLETNNNRTKAADILGVGRATFYRFLSKHQLDFK